MISEQALVLACKSAGRSLHHYRQMAEDLPLKASITAHARAIEAHEAFRQEVSDACKKWTEANVNCREPHDLDRFIIPKPDPLVEALEAALWDVSNVKLTDGELVRISNTIAASGLEVRKIGEGE